jgi:DNA ligase-1
LFDPVAPMLAQSAKDVAEALGRLGSAAYEYKLDGARIQIHRSGDTVRIFSRRMTEATDRLPDLVRWAQALAPREFILEAEAIALAPGGRPRPFQVTMSRFSRSKNLAETVAATPLAAFAFDLLYLDGRPLLATPYQERYRLLAEFVPEEARMPRCVTDDAAEAERLFQAALAAGHEGLMAKALAAPYVAGQRGSFWLKIKRPSTLDLVVLAAEWGSGRRTGWLSNLHLGARDPERGGFVMLGKTFKGLTDAMLREQTEALLALETGRDAMTVQVRPERVIEVAFEGLQRSPRYPGGLALRFARVRRYRPDKTAAEADTFQTVLELFNKQSV